MRKFLSLNRQTIIAAAIPATALLIAFPQTAFTAALALAILAPIAYLLIALSGLIAGRTGLALSTLASAALAAGVIFHLLR